MRVVTNFTVPMPYAFKQWQQFYKTTSPLNRLLLQNSTLLLLNILINSRQRNPHAATTAAQNSQFQPYPGCRQREESSQNSMQVDHVNLRCVQCSQTVNRHVQTKNAETTQHICVHVCMYVCVYIHIWCD